jgi:hypothetical protein
MDTLSDDDLRGIERWGKAFTRRGVYARTNKAKSFVELMTALDFVRSARVEYGVELLRLESREPPEPDIRCVCDGHFLSMELSELMDEELVARKATLNEPWATYNEPFFSASQWTRPKFRAAVARIVHEKGSRKYESNGMAVGVDALLMHTSEPWLSPSDCADWLLPRFQLPENIRSAFLLFGAHGIGGRHSPVLRVS